MHDRGFRGLRGRPDTMVAAAPTAAEDAVWKAPPAWLPPTLHALAYRDFLLLWLAQLSNSLALWMEQVARPILVLVFTGSSVHLGLVVAARGLPQLFMGPLAGVVADRIDRRVVLLTTKTLGTTVYFIFALLILAESLELWHIYVTAVIKSMLNAFDGPARHALVPNLVPPRLLVNAVAINTGSMQLIRVGAASIAGFAIALIGMGGTFLIIAVCSAVAVTLTYLMRVPAWARLGRSGASWGRSLLDGLAFAWREKAIFAILVLLAFHSMFGTPYLSVFVPLLAFQFLDFSFLGAFGLEGRKAQEVGLGLFLSASSGGALLGALLIATIGSRLRRRGLIILAGLTLYGTAIAAVALSSLSGVVALPFLFVGAVGVGQSLLLPVKNAIILDLTPNEIRGRVMSLQSLDRGLTTLGSSGGGFLAAAIGAPFGMALYGAAVAVAAVGVGLLLPALRRVD
ncbi:MAG: MFS transporter [Chloroflexi bacterium]|nr:MFS transporter [Chloroflexota bacterium]